MNEKKKYTAPTAEKVEFDYTESVEACPSGCADPGHTWHAGNTYPACYGNGNGNNNNNISRKSRSRFRS